MKNLDCDQFLGISVENLDKVSGYHVPVLGQQVMGFLQPGPGGLFLDGTAGGGGHTRMMLEAGAEVVALDQDPEALAECRRQLGDLGDECAWSKRISRTPMPRWRRSAKRVY
jgi:16S rRNA C1402 N4-methylase RsmH